MIWALAVVLIVMTTGGVVGAKLWTTHRVFGFLLGALLALVLCDVLIRVVIGKSLSMHLQEFVSKLRTANKAVPKAQP